MRVTGIDCGTDVEADLHVDDLADSILIDQLTGGQHVGGKAQLAVNDGV